MTKRMRISDFGPPWRDFIKEVCWHGNISEEGHIKPQQLESGLGQGLRNYFLSTYYRIYGVLLVGVFIILSLGINPSCKSQPENCPPYPSTLSVRIMPENPRASGKLSVVTEGVEGENTAFKYCWKRNGKEIFGENVKTLSHFNFSKHDAISVVVTPLQGEAIGRPVESASVVIINTEPIISSATIQPQPSYTDSQLEVKIKASDEDDDLIVYSCQWIKNGEEILNETSHVLSSSCFERGDSIQCRIIPSDREVYGRTFEADSIRIANSPPLITSRTRSEIACEGFFMYKIDTNDPDHDILVLSLSSSAPDGMTLDPATGIVEWKIPKGLTGSYPIDIIVSDGYGGRCSQTFNIYTGES